MPNKHENHHGLKRWICRRIGATAVGGPTFRGGGMRCLLPVLSCWIAVLAPWRLYGKDSFSVTDYTGRGFLPDLVRVEIPHGTSPGIVDDLGKVYAVQFADEPDGRRWLYFVTDLPKGATKRFRLTPTRQPRKSFRTPSVTFPPERDTTFDPPVPANSLPSPISGFGDGRLGGGGRILTGRPVKALRVEHETGPVFTECRYAISWAGGGYYRARIRVIDGVPVVKIREDFDLGALDGRDFWEIDLVGDGTPDTAEVASTNGNGGVDRGHEEPLDTLRARLPLALVPDHAWGTLSQIGIFNSAARTANPEKYPAVGVIPLHKGDWRRVNALWLESNGGHDLRVRFPMSVRHASWRKEVTSETSPYSTHEHDPALPVTYGRRHWGLVLGAPPAFESQSPGPFYQLRLFYGVVGLNDYKDFILDWDEKLPDHPLLYPEPDRAAALENSSLPDALKQKIQSDSYILSGGDIEIADRQLPKVLDRLRAVNKFAFTSPTVSHHAWSGYYTVAGAADDLLAWPGLPPEKRREIRARLALQASLYAHPDVGSYNNGNHHGNPNMGTARLMPASTFVALLPDHPMYSEWKRHWGDYTAYKSATQIAPGGGYVEFGSAYHMHGAARTSNALGGLHAMDVSTMNRLFSYYEQDWDYYMNLLTPFDSRWQSRMIPGMANSPPGNTEHFAEAAGVLAPANGKLAANLMWAWHANGANPRFHHLAAPFGITPKAPDLRSRLYPGVGVVFRAHQGPDETYMLLRGGYNWSHWYIDPGHFIMMSRGALLVPYQPYQYYSSPNKTLDMYNTIRFGHPENQWPHGWADSNVIDHHFADNGDYAWISTGFPDWFIDPGVAEEWIEETDAPVSTGQQRMLDEAHRQSQGAFTWDRQVMFLKGKTSDAPNYFVIRDSTTGDGKMAGYLFLNLLGTRAETTAKDNRIHHDSEWDVDLEITFANKKNVEPEMVEENHLLAFYNANLNLRRDTGDPVSPNWVSSDGRPVEPNNRIGRHGGGLRERHTILRLSAGPGEGYFWVLYPRKPDEPSPEIEKLQDSVIRITHPDGSDLVYLSPRPDNVTAGGAHFTGQAVALRLADGQPPAAVLASANSSATWQGRRFSNAAPTPDRSEPTVESEGKTIRFRNPRPEYAELVRGNVAVKGTGPFDLVFSTNGIAGTVSGAMRTLVCTWPEAITRPMYHMDGVRWYAGWADDHSIAKGTKRPQYALAFAVTGGVHRVEIGEWTYPVPPPQAPWRRLQ